MTRTRREKPGRPEILAAVWKVGGKEQVVLLLRYGLLDGHRHDLFDVSKMVRSSREGVHILQRKGLRKLAAILGDPGLADWLDSRLSKIGGERNE